MRTTTASRARWRAAVAFAAAALMFIAAGAKADVRAISEAERAAVETAAAYLSRGPEAVHERLSAVSPLRRFTRDEALAEIEVRLGPPTGARWELQTVVPALKDRTAVFSIEYPSGIDETVIVDLAAEGGGFKIIDLRMLAQKSPRPQVFPPLVVANAAPAAPTPSQPLIPPVSLALVGGLLAAALAFGAPFLVREYRPASRWLLVAAVALVALSVFAIRNEERFAIFHEPPPPELPKKDKADYARLGSLVPLRRILAAGTGEIEGAFRAANRVGQCGDVVDLWRAQYDLAQVRVDEVKRALKRFRSPSDVPLAEILRGRLALFENDEAAAAVAYEHAVNLGPGRDGLWYETAQALSALGFDDRAASYLHRLHRIGSREADVYYSLSVLAASKNNRDKEDEAEARLQDAWRLKPAERSELVETAVLWSVLRRVNIATAIKLNEPGEATFTTSPIGSRAVTLPPDAWPRVSGDFLHVQIGEQELQVPGGASLAPMGTPTVDAAAWARSERERGLRDVQQLAATSRNAATFAQPALRHRFIRAANALAEHNRWLDLAQLTEGLSPASDHVPPELLFLRNIALQRLGQTEEAKRLMSDLAASRVLQRKKDAQSLVQLGEMLASYELFEPAIQMFDRSASIRPNPFLDDRVRQIQMNARLATKYSVHFTDHFEIRFPEDVSQVMAVQIGNVLEAEFKRLQKWVPTPNFKQISVNVVWWQEFRNTYTGSDFILGFYQGNKITVPFAGVGEFSPPIVALLTHELCHAMLAQATNEQAPRWFQEGLAQRVEMRPYHPNAFNMYTDDKLLAVSLLDSVMRGSPDPDMISEAYIESQTVIRYLESKYGAAGITKLIAAFREGANTEEAIARVTTQSLAAFDGDLRAWGRKSAQVFDNPPGVRYDNTQTDGIRWAPIKRDDDEDEDGDE